MAGRIRTIKPEWLDDEHLSLASPCARVLSIGLILLADDFGNGRAGNLYLLGRVFPGKAMEVLIVALDELVTMRFIELYEINGQRYFLIRNWGKHQRVDNPGRPIVPSMDGSVDTTDGTDPVGYTYIARLGSEGPLKIGFSHNPDQRADGLSRQQPEVVSILASMPGRKYEKALHRRFAKHKRRGEWFEPIPEILKLAEIWGKAHHTKRPSLSNGRAWTGMDGHEDVAPDLDLDLDLGNGSGVGSGRGSDARELPGSSSPIKISDYSTDRRASYASQLGLSVAQAASAEAAFRKKYTGHFLPAATLDRIFDGFLRKQVEIENGAPHENGGASSRKISGNTSSDASETHLARVGGDERGGLDPLTEEMLERTRRRHAERMAAKGKS